MACTLDDRKRGLFFVVVSHDIKSLTIGRKRWGTRRCFAVHFMADREEDDVTRGLRDVCCRLTALPFICQDKICAGLDCELMHSAVSFSPASNSFFSRLTVGSFEGRAEATEDIREEEDEEEDQIHEEREDAC